MKKIILIAAGILMLTSAYCQVSNKFTYPITVQGVTLTGPDISAVKNATPASSILVMKSDSAIPTAGSYTTRYDFENESTPSFFERIYKEQRGVKLLFPATPNPVSNGSAALTSGTVYFTLVNVNSPVVIPSAYYSLVTAGSFVANNVNSISLYKDDGAGNLTKVAETANSGTVWTQTALTMITIAFTSSYAATPGKYYTAATYSSSSQTTAPSVAIAELIGVYANQILTYPISGKLTGQTSAPPTTTVAAIRATSGNPLAIFLKY